MTFLLFVTIVSLLVAAVMSIVAWRIAGEERRRSEARVTVLASDGCSEPPIASSTRASSASSACSFVIGTEARSTA